jgi:hypothetical protein
MREESSEDDSDGKYSEAIRKYAADNIVFAIEQRQEKTLDTRPRSDIRIGEDHVNVMIDTGSTINVLSEHTYAKFTDKPRLYTCKTEYYGFKSDTPIPIVGQFATTATRNNIEAKAGFIVVSGHAENILGYKTAVELKIINETNEINSLNTRKKRKLGPKGMFNDSESSILKKPQEAITQVITSDNQQEPKLVQASSERVCDSGQSYQATHEQEAVDSKTHQQQEKS